MKERLIQLIEEARFWASPEMLDIDVEQENAFIADFLLKNGVRCAKLPIGKTVYVLYATSEYTWKKGRTRKNNHQILTNEQLRIELLRGTVEIREKPCGKQDALLLGRLVFESREEAEAAIKRKETT